MALTGDFRGLGMLRANLARLAKVPAQAAPKAAEGITRELQRQFVSGTDPYGRAWRPLKKSTVRRKGHAKIWYETGASWAQCVATPMSGAGIKIGPLPEYAIHAARMRPLLPYGGMPATWNAAIKAAVQQCADAAMGGR